MSGNGPNLSRIEDFADRIKPRSASNLLLWMIIGFFVLFVLWASLTTLDRAVHAAGRVVPSSRLQVVSNLEGGIVDAIAVHPGDKVTRGQVLVQLDAVQSGAELGSSRSTVASLTAKTARLEAEIAGREPDYPAPRNTAEAEQIAIERALHTARVSELASESAVASAAAAAAARAVAEAEAAYTSRVSARDSAKTQLELIRPLVERGIEPRVTLVQLENQASIGTSDAAQAAAAIAHARESAAEARARVAQTRYTWKSQAAAELAAAQAEMATRTTSATALADRVRRSRVLSPVDGRVNRVLVSTVGSSIGPGQPIVEVVPGADALTVEALVSPRDIAGIRIGQRARINITAYESAIYGGMDGHVVTISPDATTDEKTGESHYTVRLRTDTAKLRDPSGRDLPIGPGMTAEVNLLGEKRSIMSYILTPVMRLRDDAFHE